MASFLSAIACPHCGCCSTEDDYYKLGEKFIWCFRCGYYYEKAVHLNESDEWVYSEKEYKGFGILCLYKEKEKESKTIFHRRLSSQEISDFSAEFSQEDVDLEKSYFVLYEDGEFTIVAGSLPNDFYIPFYDYKELKEANGEQVKVIFPG